MSDLVDIIERILEDAQDEPHFTRREHALMGAGEVRREYLAAHDREVKAEAQQPTREVVDALLRQAQADRKQAPYWQDRQERYGALDHVESWLYSLRDHIESQGDESDE